MTEYIETADEQHPGAAPISIAHLREHARAAAMGWGVTRRPLGKGAFSALVEAARASLDELYAHLDQLPPPEYAKIERPDPILELRENPRLLRSVILEATSLRRKIPQLPRVITQPSPPSQPPGPTDAMPRNLFVARAFFDATDSVWNAAAFRIYIEEIQKDDPLDLEELWSIPTFLKFHLLDQILDQARTLVDSPSTVDVAFKTTLSSSIGALRDVSFADWVPLLESLIVFDPTLHQDPAQSYSLMVSRAAKPIGSGSLNMPAIPNSLNPRSPPRRLNSPARRADFQSPTPGSTSAAAISAITSSIKGFHCWPTESGIALPLSIASAA